jgi:hypothetical protein
MSGAIPTYLAESSATSCPTYVRRSLHDLVRELVCSAVRLRCLIHQHSGCLWRLLAYDQTRSSDGRATPQGGSPHGPHGEARGGRVEDPPGCRHAAQGHDLAPVDGHAQALELLAACMNFATNLGSKHPAVAAWVIQRHSESHPARQAYWWMAWIPLIRRRRASAWGSALGVLGGTLLEWQLGTKSDAWLRFAATGA